MIVGRWYVQLAALWHWYLLWCIYITVLNFILCLSIPFLYFLKSGIDELDRMVGDTSNSSKICV